jgi:hypothetical protein
MNAVVNRLRAILSAPPEPVLAASRVGSARPSSTNEIPAIVVSLTVDSCQGIGIGRFFGSGDKAVKCSAAVEVTPEDRRFSGNLKTFDLRPLPLRKDPSSVGTAFTEKDVLVTNLTDPANQVVYRMVPQPVNWNEYRVDPVYASVIFGEAQTQGDKLEVVHWTITPNEEIFGERYNGDATLEIWAGSRDKVSELSRKVESRVKAWRGVMREQGFLKFTPASLGPLEKAAVDPDAAYAAPAWRQTLGYRFAVEVEETSDVSGGSVIKRIDIDVDSNLAESFDVKE